MDDNLFVAALYRGDDTQPFAVENPQASNWDEAANLAEEWAMTELGGGIFERTKLQLKHGGRSAFLRTWDPV